MENGYTDELTIDRINPDEDYCPENCRWLSRSENTEHRWETKHKAVITMSEKFNQREYDKTHTTRYQLKLNNETDRDIIEKLAAVKSKQGYIKECIRKDLASK